jgi:integrase/recombinase XerD
MKYPTMRFVFDRKKVATKTHKGLVQIEVLSEGKRKWIGTGVKVYSDQWNDRKKIINSVEMIQLNQCLDEQLRIIQNWINELISKKEVFDFDKLDRFLRYTNKSESFVDFVERRIEERGDITESTKASHRTFAASLREFDRIIYFSDLTKANITLYDDWLHAKGYSQPTIYNYHKRNKRYIHEAIKFDLLKNDPYKGEHFTHIFHFNPIVQAHCRKCVPAHVNGQISIKPCIISNYFKPQIVLLITDNRKHIIIFFQYFHCRRQ